MIQQNGDLRQCCQMIEQPFGKFLDDGRAIKFDSTTVDAIRNHDTAKTLRRAMMAGEQPSACKLCWDEEAVGVHSKRLSMLQKYPMAPLLAHTAPDGTIDDIPLEYIDLRLGNLCNLKCRSCGPKDSSLWVDDFGELEQHRLHSYGGPEYQIVPAAKGWRIDSDDFDWHNDPTFYQWLDTKLQDGLRRFYFTGGEPTVNKNHMRILRRIVELGKAPDVILEYNSNMVAIPPNLLSLWGNFKSVGIGISVDAIGSLAHYVRHPSIWPQIERNCDAIGYGQLANLRGGLATTVSVLNVRHFIKLSEWLVGKVYKTISKYPSWHLLHTPDYLSIQILPDTVKAMISEEYEAFYHWIEMNFGVVEAAMVRRNYASILKFMHQQSATHLLPKFKAVTERLDAIRHESLADHLPWLAALL